MMSLFLFLFIQVIVNMVLRSFIPLDNIFGVAAFYLASSLIISFIAAFMSTPPGYKKDFIKQPGFHKTMLMYFGVFMIVDLILLFL